MNKSKISRDTNKYGESVIFVDNGISRYIYYHRANGYIYKYTAYGELINVFDGIKYKK